MAYSTPKSNCPSSSRQDPAIDAHDRVNTNWIFQSDEFKQTPSSRDGILFSNEKVMRSKGISFLALVGMHLQLPQQTLYVAATMFHRFYMRFSIKRHHYYDIGATCIFLSTKVEETNRKLKDIVIACCRVAQKNDKLVIDEQSKEYWRWRDIILFNEELLLEAMCFDFGIPTPYHTLMHYTRKFVKDDKNRIALTKSAWAFVNDSARTTLCLRYSPRVLAAAALYCASTICHVNIFSEEHGRMWWEEIDVSIVDIKDACNIMADLYESSPSNMGDQKYTRQD
ncbi:cyclin-like protein [Lipomyces kononenkoae]